MDLRQFHRMIVHWDMAMGRTGMVLLANADSHFPLQKPTYIMEHFFAEQQIGSIDSFLLSLVTFNSK
jgi:hypothetical protein